MFDWFKKKKNIQYLNCPFLKNSIHFFHNNIRACCSNVSGPVFFDNFVGETMDTDNLYEQRKQLVKNINDGKYADGIPECCKNCCEVKANLQNEKISDFENKIERIYFQNNMSCNAKCIYCVFGDEDRGYNYKVLPIVKDMIKRDLLAENVLIYMSGGEITIYPEFDELFEVLSDYKNSFIEIFSSGIKYSEAINNGFKNNKTRMVISLDSGSRETYFKIKCVDCFDDVVNNIKTYVSTSDKAKDKIVLKYILVDGLNDNKDEIEKFINLVVSIGIKRVRLDIDYQKYKYSEQTVIPEHYFDLYDYFHKSAEENNLTIEICEQSEDIFKNSKKQKSGV